MVVALILLVVSGLIVAPLLSHMGTGLVTGEVYGTRTAELYAADAGVEDAIWSISNQSIPPGLWQESGDQPGWWIYEYPEPLIVNGKSVDVTVYRKDLDPTCGQELIYRILATAVTDDGGGTAAITGTQIEAYVTGVYDDLSGFLDNAITSNDNVTIRPGSTVSGNISLPPDGELDPSDFDPENGEVNREELIWPSAKDFVDFYWPGVEHLDPYPDGYVVNIPFGTTETNPYVIGPLSAEGNLTIKGEGWIEIGGTIYVKGDLVFNANPEINMNLNQQTIFAEGNIYIPPKVTISGSGCIIAVGDVDFNPNISTTGEDFLLIMSVEGTIKLNPGSDFYGAVVGNVDVTLQPGINLTWLSPEGKGIKFPGADPNDTSKWTWEIKTWQINRLPRE